MKMPPSDAHREMKDKKDRESDLFFAVTLYFAVIVW